MSREIAGDCPESQIDWEASSLSGPSLALGWQCSQIQLKGVILDQIHG